MYNIPIENIVLIQVLLTINKALKLAQSQLISYYCLFLIVSACPVRSEN